MGNELVILCWKPVEFLGYQRFCRIFFSESISLVLRIRQPLSILPQRRNRRYSCFSVQEFSVDLPPLLTTPRQRGKLLCKCFHILGAFFTQHCNTYSFAAGKLSVPSTVSFLIIAARHRELSHGWLFRLVSNLFCGIWFSSKVHTTSRK